VPAVGGRAEGQRSGGAEEPAVGGGAEERGKTIINYQLSIINYQLHPNQQPTILKC
jgi:hypothetical protein